MEDAHHVNKLNMLFRVLLFSLFVMNSYEQGVRCFILLFETEVIIEFRISEGL